MLLIDANVALTLCVVFDGRDKDGRIVRVERHNREAVADVVDPAIESGDLGIPYTAADEADRAARGAVRSAAKDAGAVEYCLGHKVLTVNRRGGSLSSIANRRMSEGVML